MASVTKIPANVSLSMDTSPQLGGDLDTNGQTITGSGDIIITSSGAGINLNTHSDAGDDLAVNTSALVIEGNTGNVGLGTTTPLSTLSINGGLHVGGDSDAGDNNLLVDGTIAGSNLSGTNTGDVDTNISWTAGTTAGPVCNSSNGTNEAIPIASGTASGVITTGNQTIAGVKSFSSAIAADGGGVVFPATAVPSADANTLDDYEEGTWTPQVWGMTEIGSAATYSGTYTVIGNRLYYEIKIIPGSTSVGTDAAATSRLSLPSGFTVSTPSPAPMASDGTGSGATGDTGLGVGMNYTNDSVYLCEFTSASPADYIYIGGHYKI
jgi:hypothetical protein